MLHHVDQVELTSALRTFCSTTSDGTTSFEDRKMRAIQLIRKMKSDDKAVPLMDDLEDSEDIVFEGDGTMGGTDGNTAGGNTLVVIGNVEQKGGSAEFVNDIVDVLMENESGQTNVHNE